MGSSMRGGCSWPLILPRRWHCHPLPSSSGDGWNTSSPQASFVSSKLPGNGWLDTESSVSCRLGRCLSRPTRSLWGCFFIFSVLLKEGQILCKMYGWVGLHTDCFSWRGCYSESDPHSPPSSLPSASRHRAHFFFRNLFL